VPESVVLLHGFGGTSHAWDRLGTVPEAERYSLLAVDLPGHGSAAGVEPPITFETCVADVLAGAPERFVLCGYSLGARVALRVSLAAPERVERLVLVSGTAGIEDAAERAARRSRDRALASQLERLPFEQCIACWRSQPVFAGEPEEVARLAAEDHRRNRPEALAEALRGLGTGEMPPLWDRLGELEMPVAVLAGERDSKFAELGRRLAASLPRAELLVVPGGHNLALENPAAVVGALGAGAAGD
jgi:2-succinyl-6-hydroxy-2,4-cyclohexadiene-1-carboxylate synthase